MIVSSLGGHLVQMRNFYMASPENVNWTLVTEDRLVEMNLNWFKGNIELVSSHSLGIKKYFSLLVNLIKAFRLLYSVRPDVLISTGSHTAIPFFLAARFFKVRSVFVLSFARRNTRAKSADIIYYLSDTFIVQWIEALKNYPNAIYLQSTFYL